MPLSRGTQLTLGAATAVEAFAGVSLLLRPRRFVQSAYRVDRVDPLAEKYARTSGIALTSLGLLSGLCLATGEAPAPTLATLALYNCGAAANNAAAPGGRLLALLHAALGAALLRCLARAPR